MRKLLVIAIVASVTFGIAFGQDAKIGGVIKVLGVWGGQEADTFAAMNEAFTNRTGVKVEFEATRDLDAVLTTRIQAGNPPDIVVLPNPGKLYELARAGRLVDLSKVLNMREYNMDYSPSWTTLASVNGKLYGLFVKAAIKGLVWYSPEAIKAAGITLPTTWDDMIATSKKIAATGTTPWSVGIESGAASGWVGTDWLANIFLRLYGPEKYRDWYEGRISWTSPEVKKAWQYFGEIVADPSMVYGGSQYINSTRISAMRSRRSSKTRPRRTSTCRPASSKASLRTNSPISSRAKTSIFSASRRSIRNTPRRSKAAPTSSPSSRHSPRPGRS